MNSNHGIARKTATWVAVTALLLAAAGTVQADSRQLVGIDVYPDAIHLNTYRDHQRVIVQARYSDEITSDVSQHAEFRLADESLVERDGNVLTPAADGDSTLTVVYEGYEVEIPLHVEDAEQDRPISFGRDVVPVFTKAGCNAGACHGSAQGQDGFHISLFGDDPDGDYFRLTREMSERRINVAIPEESLLLTKATGEAQHTGGQQFTRDSEYYQTIVRWLESGAPPDSSDTPTVEGIEIFPDHGMVLEGEGDTQQLLVMAYYSNGTTRDVTTLAAYVTSNPQVGDISEDGVVTAGQRGEAFLTARFDEHVVGTPAIVLPADLEYEEPDFPPNNYIDEHIATKLVQLRMHPSELAGDEVFIRRAYLDIVGEVPTPDEVQAFVADGDPDKRENLVDELLQRKEFVELWVMQFAELLKIKSDGNPNRGISYKGAILYHNWLQRQFAENVPINQIVREMIAASGGTFTDPATNYYQVERNTLLVTENTAQAFMGIRLQCAQCHNDPFSRWTMDDYYGFNAFFTQIGRKNADDPREQIVFNRGSGNSTHPLTGQNMDPKFLGGPVPDVSGQDRREVVAEWLTSAENPYFARNLVNRVWAHFFGRGIVEPVDDMRITNPPSNPDLLDALAERFIEYDYDFRQLVRDITTSRTYQLSTQSNETNELDESNFSRAYIRRMRAEVMFDVVSQVTDTSEQNKFRGLPEGARAVQIADGGISNYFLTTFGRASRETVDASEVCTEPNLSQALHLMNGETLHSKIRAGGVVQRMFEEGVELPQVIEQLYLRALARAPTEKEMEELLQLLEEESNLQEAVEDVFWALLNTKEFLFNR